MTLHSCYERFGENFLQFGGIIGPLELSCAGEGVLGVGCALYGGEGLVSDGGYLYHDNFTKLSDYYN